MLDMLEPRNVYDVATVIRKYLYRYNIKANVEVNPVTDNKEVAYTITCECYRNTDNV